MLYENMSNRSEITDEEQVPKTGRLTPIGGASSDTDYTRRSLSV